MFIFNCKNKSNAPVNILVQPKTKDGNNSVHRETSSKQPDFIYSFRPFYYFCRILGLMPFSIVYDSRKNTGKPKVFWFDGLWFAVSMCLYLSMTFISYRNLKIPQYSNASYILIIGDSFHKLSGLIFGALIIGMDMCNRFKLLKIWRKFIIFDKEACQTDVFFLQRFTTKFTKNFHVFYSTTQMGQFKIYFNYKRQYQHAWFCCASAVTVVLVLTVTSLELNYTDSFYGDYSKLFSIISFVSIMLQNSISAAALMSYTILLLNLRKRLTVLNSILRSIDFFAEFSFVRES